MVTAKFRNCCHYKDNLLMLEICTLMRIYAAYSGKSLLTFRDKLSAPSSKVNSLKMGKMGFPETSVTNCQSRCVKSHKSADLNDISVEA